MNESDDKEKKEYEERLQRRLKILKKQFEEGKIVIAEGLKVIDSIQALRYLPDGSVDLDTVDGLVHTMALNVEHLQNRERLKNSISLSEIQKIYFTILEKRFGHFYKVMSDKGLNPHDLGMSLSSEKSIVEELVNSLPDFLNLIEKFWRDTSDVVHAHVEDMNVALKGVFGGDLFPEDSENIASKCGIYTDTLILPDPFLRSLWLFERWAPEKQAYYLIKHALNLLKYKDLACADIDPPIVVIAPDKMRLVESEKAYILELGRDDALIHAGRVFGREFDSFDELVDYSNTLNTLEMVVSAIADGSRVLFDTEWKGSVKDQIARVMKDPYAQLLGTDNQGVIVASEAVKRMTASNELLIKTRRLRGIPIIEAPTSWQYLVWKMEYDAEHVEKRDNMKELHVVRGLQNLANWEMEWLGNVPPEALIEIRQQGAMDDIREILGKGIEQLAASNPNNYHRSHDQVFDNISEAFDQHKQNIKELQGKRWKFAGTDIASWLVIGTLEVTAAAIGMPVWGMAAIAADQLLDAPKLKDIPGSIKELAKESKELNQSPVGLLFNVSKKA